MHAFAQPDRAALAPAATLKTPQSAHSAQQAHKLQLGLQSAAQPLDLAIRCEMEQYFQHDFSQVRVHSGADAARSAQALQAHAYTFGNHIVFNSGQFAPQQMRGQQLLAHELAHVIQQSNAPHTDLTSSAPGIAHAGEAEANLAAQQLAGSKWPPHAKPARIRHRSNTRMIARLAQCEELPGFSQNSEGSRNNSCGAASLVTALLIWDRERKNPNAPNTLLIAALNNVLLDITQQLSTLQRQLNKTQQLGGNTNRLQAEFDKLKKIYPVLQELRNQAQSADGKFDQADYEYLGQALYALQKEEHTEGIKLGGQRSLQKKLGMDAPGISDPGRRVSFDELLKPLSALRPGQIAQVSWFSRGALNQRGEGVFTPHAFLLGRLQRGAWFVSDQGSLPPFQLEAESLEALKQGIRQHTSQNNKGIHTGGYPAQADLLSDGGVSEVGLTILANQGGIEAKVQSALLQNGEFLAEVDNSIVRFGDKIRVTGFIAYAHSLEEARQIMARSGSDGGAAMVEKPQGLFAIYKTNLVSEHNAQAGQVDANDSSGGAFSSSPQRFFQAWLQLRSPSGRGALFQVY
ncbi:DUF4157 domain-containing protein [Massilia sp. W12]|uniref:eCIS core domain-containing protein n=1 Tax=Massilia sp. W12 TaxID=3126507 RepID=UPI0030D62283